ncbi:MAG: hypothetical protein LLF28_01910 [Nitrospiraceae bacterium]|nr:hypothetical protein [Nitrospiraceae bacterium]
MLEKRKSSRQYLKESAFLAASILDFKTARVCTLECVVNDESDAGIGVKLKVPVAPGNFVRFLNAKEEKKGFVVWNAKIIDNNIYRAGIKLI